MKRFIALTLTRADDQLADVRVADSRPWLQHNSKGTFSTQRQPTLHPIISVATEGSSMVALSCFCDSAINFQETEGFLMRLTRLVSSRLGKVILSAVIATCVSFAANAQTVQNNGTGTNNGFFYSLFTSSGSSTMTFPQASKYPGNYAISWSHVGDVVGGKGWRTGSSRSVGYNVGSASGYNTISVYGWTTSPLVEYYINELGSLYTANATHKGSVSSDGHTYQTYEHQQVNQPSIIGTATFEQYLDAWGGSSTGSNHTVTTGNHFSHWQSIGMPMGSFNYMILATEAYNGASGQVNATVW
jgi:endo-1,4-beta-xylanase